MVKSVSRIGFLEGLRGLLAIWVMLCHVGAFVGLSGLNKAGTSDVVHPGRMAHLLIFVDGTGTAAVVVFMILSGFVIFNLLDNGKESYAPFLLRRFFRLWPVFILGVLLGVLFSGLYVGILEHNPWSENGWIRWELDIARVVDGNKLPYLLWDFSMLHGAVPVSVLRDAGGAFSPLAWCISTEWQFYVVAPLFYFIVRRWYGLVGLSLAVIFCELRPEVFAFSINPTASLLPFSLRWFFLGMISYLVYRNIKRDGLTARSLFGALFIVLIVTAPKFLHGHMGFGGPFWLLCFALIVDSLFERRNAFCRRLVDGFNSKAMRYLGRISYPIYLLHWPVCLVLVKLLILGAPSLNWQVAYLILIVLVPALTIPVAHLTHIYFEEPFMEYGKKLAAKVGSGTSQSRSKAT